MPKRITEVEVREATSVTHRISIGLIALSLSLVSLALGISLLTLPLPASVFIATPPTAQSVPSTATAVTLNWTAPGDDANTGQAASYDLRYSTSPITSGTFGQATSVAGVPAPQVAGSTETYTVTSLQPATTYFFALETADEAGNVSAMSNVASKTTATLPAACVPTYQCSGWSACTNGQQTRTCSVTNNCQSGLNQPVTQQSCTTDAGGAVSHLTSHMIAVGAAPGTTPVFRLIDPSSHKVLREVLAFDRKDRHGVNVAVGDLDGDHKPDIAVGSGAGAAASVKLFTTAGKVLATFNPYPTSSKTGVAVAVGDINGDGRDELLTIPAKGTSQLRAFSYDSSKKKFTALAQAFVYNQRSANGFSLATGDLNNDGRVDIVVAPRTNGSSIIVMTMSSKSLKQLSTFHPYPLTFKSGLTVTVGDVDGNGREDIITAPGPGYYTDLKVFDLKGHLQTSFKPTSRSYLGALTISTLDVNQDGVDEIITGTYQNGNPGLRYYQYSGLTKKFGLSASFNAYPGTMKSGLRVASQ